MKTPVALLVSFSVLAACCPGAFGADRAAGNPAPNDASSFRLPLRTTYQGRCLAILRPQGDAGKITLKAEADGVKAATIVVKTR